MEPYRPFVDKLVVEIVGTYYDDDVVVNSQNAPISTHLTKEIKTKLLQIPVLDVIINGQRSPLMIAVTQTTASLARCFLGENRKIVYPSFE